MKKKFVCLLCALLFFCAAVLSGCWSARELNSLMIVLGVGFDKDTEQPQNIRLTAQLVLPDKMKKQGSAEKPYWNVVSTGQNTFEAVRNYSQKLNDRLYIAHTEVFIFGRALAEEGISKPFDFFIRAKETRLSALILISATTAEEMLATDSKTSVMSAINITKMIQAQRVNSKSEDMSVSDYINGMLSKTTSFVAPLAGIETQGDAKVPYIKGLAVFKHDKMVGELNEIESRGLSWAMGWVEGGAISVNMDDGQAAIDIQNASGTITPKLDGNQITMKIAVETAGVMAQQTTTDNLATVEKLKEIEKAEKEAIQKEILGTFEKAKTLHADVFGFGEAIHRSYPKQWKDMEDKWDSLFPEIKLEFDIKTKLTGAGGIEKPVQPE